MPALDAYYEAEYLRDGDFWCSHEGSVAIWLEQYRYLCHLIGCLLYTSRTRSRP